MLLRPSKQLNQIIYGILARAARLYDMRVCAFIYLSNHCHLLIRPSSAEQMSEFMGYLNGNVAREAGRLHRWREKFWGRRYTDVLVSFEAEAQVDRLAYLLAQGCKENLVSTPRDWPGASSVHSLLTGQPIRGVWIDRARRYRAMRAGVEHPMETFESSETLELSPLPCWDELDAGAVARLVHDIVRKVTLDARKGSGLNRRRTLGRRRILRQDPHQRPRRMKRSPAPRFHTATLEIRRMLEMMYREYHDGYRAARERFRDQILPFGFPRYGIPPPWAPAAPQG